MLFYEKEIKAFNKNRIKYLVIGGLAVNLYGLHRMTMDLDLLIDLSSDSLERFLGIVEKLGYKTKVPKKEWNKHAAIAFHHHKEEDKRIDVFIKNPIEFNGAYKRRKTFKEGGIAISCVSLDDLIALKNKANRVRDWVDIGGLEQLRK